MLLLVAAGCLINTELYKERLAAVTDDDGDGVNDDQGDCDDVDADRYPGAVELCDGIDNDCNDVVDDGTYEAEVCDGVDNDCDGATDEDLATTWFLDGDGDGYGNDARSTEDCAQPSGHVAEGADCDDGDAGLYPGAEELCDELDNDCDGSTDEDLPTSTWYTDADGDGYGTGDPVDTCAEPDDVATVDGDCDDAAADSYPGALETIDGRDQDCSGTVDDLLAEADAVVFTGTVTDGRLGSALLWADLDADGRDDLVVSAPGRGIGADPCSVLAIDAGDLASGDLSLATPLYESAYTDCGTAIAWVEAEGVVLVGEPREEGGGQVSIVDDEGALVGALAGDSSADVGSSIAVGQDMTGDGIDDLALGGPSRAVSYSREGVVYLLPGLPTSGDVDAAADHEIRGDASGARFGLRLASGGDVNADGYDDLLVGSEEYGDGGRAWLFLGGASLPSTAPEADAVFEGVSGDQLGLSVGLDVDSDADGWPEIAIASPGSSALLLFSGATRGTVTAADASSRLSGAASDDYFGVAHSPGGSAGGLVLGARDGDGRDGRVYWIADLSSGGGASDAAATVAGGSSSRLGGALAVSGTWWAMGAAQWGSLDEGAAVVIEVE
ncbi:MAG: FG-GAP repeat protein [Deltaproteobacteria bacterium]|nr:FG-GAP repeat protein [Deltaproteobacteria bacterium]